MFAEFLGEFENLAVVLVGLADVVGIFHLDQLAPFVRFAFSEHLSFREIDFCARFALHGFAVLVFLRSAWGKFPADAGVVPDEVGVERPALLGGEPLDQIGLTLFDQPHSLFAGDFLFAHQPRNPETLFPLTVFLLAQNVIRTDLA